MQSLAQTFATQLRAGDIVTLSGEVGAGKTSFARALIKSIAEDASDVTSPTFNLMQSYTIVLSGKRETLWHLDLYRLKHISEANELGLEELWPHITLIEWPQIIAPLLPAHLDIAFDFGDSSQTRSLVFRGNDAWRQRLEALR